MNIIRCCKDCPDRYPTCHDSCERYQEEKRQYDECKAAINKQKAEDLMFAAIRQESVRRTNRRKHHSW